MLTTILNEVVNGWIVTIDKNGRKQQFIYETLQEAQEHLGNAESKHEYTKKGGARNAVTL